VGWKVESPAHTLFLDIYKNNRHSFNMNFNQRIAWIQRSLIRATERREKLLAVIPSLKREIVALEKASDAADAVFLKIENCCGPEWDFLRDEAEEVVMEINGKLDQAELAWHDAQGTVYDIEGCIESTSYCAEDAANA